MTAFLIVYGGTGAAVTAMAGGFALAVARDRGRPTTRAWEPGELDEPPRVDWRQWVDTHTGTQARCPDPRCQARRCGGCEEPLANLATPAPHIARHDMDEVPPSVRWLAEAMGPAARAMLVTAELMGHHVWRPAGGVAFRAWARRKLGRELQIGTRAVMLP